jgi:hypothetical protein
MSNPIRQDPELILITELCRELAKPDLTVGLSDARPAAVIRTRPHPLWVTVDVSGEFFEWSETENRPPVTDPTGAAAPISEHVRAQRSGLGEAS